MSIRDRQRQAQTFFGAAASITEDGQLCIEQHQFPLPTSTDTAMGLALLYAREYGPEALLDSVAVCRHPGDGQYIAVPFTALEDFHFRSVSGGIGRRTGRLFLYARMWCDSIPKDAAFGHSCAHGPGPHSILVCITQVANPRHLYLRLRTFAERREQLRAEVHRN